MQYLHFKQIWLQLEFQLLLFVLGTLRRFLIVVKLWANCANLFAVDEAQPRTNWNSYTLSLLAVSFLQSLKIVRPPNMKADSRIVQGWMIDYEIERFDLSAHSIMSLLKVSGLYRINFWKRTHLHFQFHKCQTESNLQLYFVRFVITVSTNLWIQSILADLSFKHKISSHNGRISHILYI